MKALIYGVVLVILIAACVLLPATCGMMVDEAVAIKALETNGFSNVRIVEKDVFFVSCKGGGEGDDVKFTAIATNPVGKEVQIDVYASWPFKAATIRVK